MTRETIEFFRGRNGFKVSYFTCVMDIKPDSFRVNVEVVNFNPKYPDAGLYQIVMVRCKEKQFATKGNVVLFRRKFTEVPSTDWEDIKPSTYPEALHKLFCKA